MVANGRLDTATLSRVQGSLVLEKRAAVAYLALKAAAKKTLDRTIAIASPGGASRTWAAQDEMHRASLGHTALAAKWHLNPHSSVALAAAGLSSHGFGTRVDIVGTVIDNRFLALALSFGFSREFGSRDPNHFMHDGRVIKVSPVAAVTGKVVARTPVYVTVRAGDTASEIAEHYRISIVQLGRLNPTIKDLGFIRVGQRMRVA